MKKILILLYVTLFSISFNAQTKTTIASGNWNNNAIWSPSGVPCNGCAAIINHTVTITAGQRIKDVTINSKIINNGFDLRVDGNWTNNGIYSDNAGSISFMGTTTQTITNKTPFYNLIINGTGQIKSTDTIWVKNGLDLTAGILNVTNGILILQNDATHNGRITSVGSTGNITGTFIAERWINRCDGLWSEYGSCMNQTIQSMNLYHTGFVGCPFYPVYNWANTYIYDETAPGSYTIGWTAPTNVNNIIGRGKGFIYWYQNFAPLSDFPRKFLMKGALDFQIPFNFGVTLTNNSISSDIGYNLLANPFPGTIDWTSVGWTRTNVRNAIYVWKTCNSVYASYINGVGTNGGSKYIPEGQGFFVKARNNNPNLQVTRQVIINNITQSLFKTENIQDTTNSVLKAFLGGDEIAIRLNSLATDSIDDNFDADAIIGDSTKLYSYIYGDVYNNIYSINSVKDSNHIIPIKTKGSGIINFDGISTFLGIYDIYLKDLNNNFYQQIYDGFQYSFIDTSIITFNTRFEIHFNKNLITNNKKEVLNQNSIFVKNDENNIYINFDFISPQKTDIIMYDYIGREIFKSSGTFFKEKDYIIQKSSIPSFLYIYTDDLKIVKKIF